MTAGLPETPVSSARGTGNLSFPAPLDDPIVLRDLMRHVRLQRPAWPWEAAKRERRAAAYLRRRLLASIEVALG